MMHSESKTAGIKMFEFSTLIILMPFNVAIAAILVGIAYAVFSLKIQRRFTNPQKTKEIQKRIQQLTKEMNEMAKRNEDISPKQAEIMPLFKESMQLQMKGMFVILPIFLVIYYGLIPIIFGAFNGSVFNIYVIPFSYSTLFIGSAIVAALVMNLAITLKDRLVAKRLKQQQTQAAQVRDMNNTK